MSAWEFVTLVSGLSSECRFWYAVQDAPKKVTDPEGIAKITGRYLGPEKKEEGPQT
jgi:hypothetical protein